jgi:GNAT superfamily N-acetyltransferase
MEGKDSHGLWYAQVHGGQIQLMAAGMEFTIADRNSDAHELAKLFSQNLSAEYISHGELQGRRALTLGHWTPNIQSVLLHELKERLNEPLKQFPAGRDWRGVLQARSGDVLVGLALVTQSHKSVTPFGTIEDLVVDRAHRRNGYGRLFIEWIISEFSQAGIHRTFLESGYENKSAHRLFESLGFKRVSVVMMRDA